MPDSDQLLATVTPASVGLKPARPQAKGFSRRRCGKGWLFLNTIGGKLSSRETERCKRLAIPPAWKDVWISPSSKSHIQACGTDAAGRRQYIYHPAWHDARQTAKFDTLLEFAECLPRIRNRTHKCLRTAQCEQTFAVCTVIGLLDSGSLRVGSRRYLERAGTVGATTLKPQHIRIVSDHLELDFPAKSGKQRHVEIDDPDLVNAMTDLLEGASTSDDRPLLNVSASQVNDMLMEMTGKRFTAKHFRTWNGSVAASEVLLKSAKTVSVKNVCEAAAAVLGNTPAIAKSAYIHPGILEAIGSEPTDLEPAGPSRLKAAERRCFGFLQGLKPAQG